jgi:phospholipid-binding lipoprotein MlaA
MFHDASDARRGRLILSAIIQATLAIQGAPSLANVPEIDPAATAAVTPLQQGQGDPQTAAPQPSSDGDATVQQGAPPASPPVPDSADDTGIVVTARHKTAGDPLAKLNAKSLQVTQTIDDNVTAPIAHAYEHTMPKPLRRGLRNFLFNLHEPVVFVNFVLQHKIGKAAETLARFAIDTTAGIGGVVDVAKRHPFNLPRRPNGFADTLGFYGVRPGAYLFLPLMGPTTVRDLAGGLLDRLMLPALPGTPFRGATWTVPTGVLHTLDKRIEFDGELQKERDSGDPYVARRDYYLAKRQAEIDALHGKTVVSQPVVRTALMGQ